MWFALCGALCTPVTAVQRTLLGTTNAVDILLTVKKSVSSIFPLF